MRTLGHWILVWAVIALLAAPAVAQRRERVRAGRVMGSRPMALLMQDSVRKELDLSREQQRSVRELAAKQRESFQGLRDLNREERQKKVAEMATENEKALAEILNPEQNKRLKQISLQVQGAAAFQDPKVAKALELSGEQKEKIDAIQQESRQSMRELFQAGANREEMQGKVEKIHKGCLKQALAVLNQDQTAKWKEMTGEPFEGEIRPGAGRFRGPAAGRRGA